MRNKKYYPSVTEYGTITDVELEVASVSDGINMRFAPPTDPKSIQKIAASGKANKVFRVGEEVIIPWTDTTGSEDVTYQYPFIVADIKDCYDQNGKLHKNAIWLMTKYSTPIQMIFDAPDQTEVDLENEPNAVEGWHYVGSNGSTSFTDINVATGEAISTAYTYVYKTQARCKSGSAASSANVCRYGLFRWSESVLRQWLNSDAASNWWTSQHGGDGAPASAALAIPGFIAGFPAAWKAIFKPVKVSTLGGVYGTDANDAVDVTYDKFFIPSNIELVSISSFTGNANDSYKEGDKFACFKEMFGVNDETWAELPYTSRPYTNAGRAFKVLNAQNGTAQSYPTRSAMANRYQGGGGFDSTGKYVTTNANSELNIVAVTVIY